MNYVNNSEKQLKQQVIAQTMKEDFAEFWTEQVKMMREVPLKVERKKISTPYEKSFITYEVLYNTHDDTVVKAYFSCPVNRKEEKMPCVSYYHGGNGRKNIHTDIISTGVCCFAIDVRSQGGTTTDKAKYTMGDMGGGLMTRDILCKETFYMRNIYLDAVRAIDVIASFPEVNKNKIVTYGASQGGALSVVAAALSGKVKKSYSAVSSYSCLQNRVEIGSGIFEPLNKFLTTYPQHTETVFNTLTYFDMNNMVSLLKTPASFMVGLSDPICLPHFVYSIYEHTPSEKEVMLVPFAPHCIADQYRDFVYNEFAQL